MNNDLKLNGILCVDKPNGFTSFDVVAKLRGITRTKKIGHAGTLDPMATGVLPMFFGQATKCCGLLPVQDKMYSADFRLGIKTDTQDITGNILSSCDKTVSENDVAAAVNSFAGEIIQLPPMYSAVKVGGRRLYQYARDGAEIERTPRKIIIYAIKITDGNNRDYSIDVHCSKGTYIRTLCADIGDMLGVGATLTGLRRTMSCGYYLKDCITLEDVQRLSGDGIIAEKLMPADSAFKALESVTLNAHFTKLFSNGVILRLEQLGLTPGGDVRVYSPDGDFLGLANKNISGCFQIIKMFCNK